MSRSPSSPEEETLVEAAADLAAAIERSLPDWVVRSVTGRVAVWDGSRLEEAERSAIAMGIQARKEVGGQIHALLDADVDDQRTTPLSLIRAGVRYPALVLTEVGVPPVGRDAFKERAFPGDIYDLAPATLEDVGPGLGELGIRWGAAKAFVHKRRHSS